ncbi:MAG: bifunctional diaminohydroxyphosphoribosylaminopyrimidine deaminase/5-amino-6-(5-phosphoribosylamino)uracil reductase RibD [Candidatus Nanopelagicaceae bacterium]
MNEEALLHRAVELSLLGRGATYPNPIVGAVVATSEGEIIAQGFHQGKEHAEILALDELQSIGNRFQELTLLLTLEPCNHHGKTPPCSDAILTRGRELGITRVVYAVSDPNPIAQGGAEKIRDGGMQIEKMEYAEARFSNRDWLTKIRLGRPRITWKVATSLDGAVAARDGSSKWITSDLSRSDVKLERSKSDAILTGTGTVIADDPSMLGAERHPVRVVIGEREISDEKKIFSQDAETIRIKGRNFDQMLEVFTTKGFNRVFVESGPTLGTALFMAGLVDEILLYQAPSIIGSNERFTKGLDLDRIDQQIRFLSEETQEIGGDIKRLLFVDNAMNREFSCSPA